MKRLSILFCLILGLLIPAAPAVSADEVISGECGEDITWTLEEGTLTISGTGAMEDGCPWEEYKGDIEKVFLTGEITAIGAGAFQNCDALTDVYFGESLHTIGRQAFKSCDRILMLTLPKTFRVFDEECFMNCKMLSKIYFEGSMPSFRLNCLWDTYADLIYPVNNPWPLEHVKQLEDAFQGRIEFMASDGSDPLVSESDKEDSDAARETEPAKETEPTEAPTEPTQPPTEAPTVPPTTEAPTQPSTEPPTEPSAEAPETTEVPTEPAAEAPAEEAPPRRSSMGIWICLLIVSGVLAFTIAGMLLVRRRRY